MSDISKEKLSKEIEKILKDADLSKTSTKKVIQALEKNLGVDLADKKKVIDQLVMEYVNTQESDDDDQADDDNDKDEEPESEEEVEKKKKTKPKKGSSSDSDYNPVNDFQQVVLKVKRSELKKNKKIRYWGPADHTVKMVVESDEDEEKPAKKKAKKRKADDDDSDDWGKKNTPKKAAKGKKAGGGAGRKNSGYTRAYKLSPELSQLMGKEEMPRHEVVKRVWEIIKERNLYDQSNKQFAICDDDLIKVIGTKRFRTFGMMKYLKTHFLD